MKNHERVYQNSVVHFFLNSFKPNLFILTIYARPGKNNIYDVPPTIPIIPNRTPKSLTEIAIITKIV